MRIRELRIKLGLTQSGLADKMEVSVRTVQDWEQGRHQPRKIVQLKIEKLIKEVESEPTESNT